MIFVYHSAPASALNNIKKDGLTPRGQERKGNFGVDLASLLQFVYLSRFKALNYGLTAVQGLRSDRVAILELAFEDLNQDLCFPDEDSIAFGEMEAEGSFGGTQHNKRFDELRKGKRPDDYQGTFASLFEKFGLVAYKGSIPFELVRRCLIAPFPALRIIADIVSDYNPSAGDIEGNCAHGDAVTRFLFDRTEMRRLPGNLGKSLRKQAQLITVSPGPRWGA
jgi:hypothetical protein